jgi:hypothetical protein
VIYKEEKMNYTKGDWEVDGLLIRAFGHGIIASCPKAADDDISEIIANANLISASPDMYEALKAILSGCEIDPNNPERVHERAMPNTKEILQGFKALAKVEKGVTK